MTFYRETLESVYGLKIFL